MKKTYYIPNKLEAMKMEDKEFAKEKYMDINFVLRRFFDEDHLNNAENLFMCEKCAATNPKGCEGRSEFFIKNPPNVLVIQLKRFKSSGFSYSKNTTVIKNIEDIYLDKYVIINSIQSFNHR